MKINANELLLMNKKVRFGEEGEKTTPQVTAPAQEPVAPQTGMNSLMFQGMMNVADNPQLATNLSVMREEVTQEEQPTMKNDQDAVAPLKTNVAFQGKASMFKNGAMAALMGLMTLGAASSLQSCDPLVEQRQEVTVDLSAMTELVSQLTTLLQQMKEQQEITNEQLKTMNAYLLQLMQEVQNGNISQEQFYQKMYAYMLQNDANQKIIIEQLVQNGKSQEEANALIKDLISKVESGQISAEEAMKTIQNLLGDIKGILGQVLNSLTVAENDRKELIELAKQGNANTSELVKQGETLIASNNAANEKLDGIKDAIEKANLDSNANFATVVKTLNMNKDQLIGVMLKLGYTQAQIEKMTAGQIIAAIKENTQVTKDNNAALNAILAEVKAGNLSAEEASKKIIDLLGQIQKSLDEVVAGIKKHYQNDAYVAVYLQKIEQLLKQNNDKTDSTNDVLNKLYTLVEGQGTKADAMGKEILNYIAAVGFEMNRNFGKLIEEVQTGNGKLDYMTELMVALNKQVKQNGEDGKKLGNEILNYLGAVGFEMNRNFTAVLEAINKGNVKLSDIEKLVAQLNKQVEKNNEDGKKLGNEILNYLGAVGFEMNRNFTAVLNAINALADKGNSGAADKIVAMLEKVLEKQDKNTATVDANCKAIIEAMGKIKVDGGKVDLSSIEAMLKDLLTQSKKNGNTLTSIDGKLDAIKLTQQGISDKIDAEAHKGDVRYQRADKFMTDVLNALGKLANNGKYDDTKLLNALNKLSNLVDTRTVDLLNAIKNHDVKVTVDVTGKVKCECNCGGKHEGILGDIENTLQQ